MGISDMINVFGSYAKNIMLGSILLSSASGQPRRSSSRKSAAKAAKHKKYLKKGKRK